MATPGCKHVRSIHLEKTNKEFIIFDAVCRTFGYHPDRVLVNNHVQKREYVIIRQITMTLFVTKLKMSLVAAGRFFEGKDHATIIHAMKTVKNLLDTNRKFKEDVGHLFVGVTFPEKRKYIKKFIERRE